MKTILLSPWLIRNFELGHGYAETTIIGLWQAALILHIPFRRCVYNCACQDST